MFAKIFGASLAGLLVVAATVSGANPPAWVRVAPENGRFTVSMPTEPKIATQQRDDLDALVKAFVSEDLLNRARFSVVYIESEEIRDMGADEMDEFLDGAQEGFLEGFSGELISSQKITVQGIVGHEIVARNPANGVHVRARLLVQGDRLYVVTVEGESLASVNNQASQDFFSSFCFTAK